MKQKVYCKNCKYCKQEIRAVYDFLYVTGYECYKFVKSITKIDAIGHVNVYQDGEKENCYAKNKNKECVDYCKKWYKFWVK